MYKKRKLFQQAGIALFMSISSTALFAAGIANVQIGGADVSLSPTVSYDIATLRVSGDSDDVTSSFTSGEQISIDVSNMADGLYHYELSLENEKIEGAPSEGAASQSGTFRIINSVASAYNETVGEAEAAVEDALKQSAIEVDIAPMVNDL